MKEDKKADAALAIRVVASSILNWNSVLKDAIGVLQDPSSHPKAKVGMTERSLKQLVVETTAVSKKLIAEVKVLDPIPSLD